ncbi:hypothetical protein NDK50_09820 [Paraburkholderia bryophila]|uniref:beta strand repeat-containing protein n=1 Tax=Paraburkholderia bryophila TaxID=420952 RepID=UPI00234984D6|nr:hypothetical protein [Paraburkholderia bryophila]WCM21719.1 hypothetical protein NDK50_09820 [Paraburkholderia bryophila]
MLKINSVRRGLMLGTEIVGAWLSWYGRAFAGSCSPATGASITCTGPAANGTDVTQNLTITAGGTVSTSSGFGIDTTGKGGNAFNVTGPGAFLDNNGSIITSGLTGVNAANATAAGSLAITTSGTVTGTANYGIHAVNGATSNNLTISAANATGGENGIYAFNHGTGALTITTSGLIQNTLRGTNSSQHLFGIYGRNAGTNLSVTAAALTGGQDGIRAVNDGTGALSINTTGVVTGVYGDGILARNNTNGTNLTVVASGPVNAYRVGVYAKNYGTGALSITTTDAVNGLAAVSIGVYARNNARGTGLTISSAGAVGGLDGIQARNFGTGALSVTASGPVTGSSRYGVFATNAGTSLSVTTGAATGGINGIHAVNNGTGGTTITSSGDVTGTSGAGVYATAGNTTSGTLTISQAAGTTITGGTHGIVATNEGTGSTSITASGVVTGTTGDGISVSNVATATTLDLTTSATVTGGINGIDAVNLGSGALHITANGNVTGSGNDGILATNGSTDSVIGTAAGTQVTGSVNGIAVVNSGAGATSITSNGAVTGIANDGILANNGTTATTLSITTWHPYWAARTESKRCISAPVR